METPESTPVVTGSPLDTMYPTMTEPLIAEGGIEQGPDQGEPDKASVKTETGADASKATPEKTESAAPERYEDLRIPEIAQGVPVDQIDLEGFTSFVKEQNLSQEQAQKLLDFGGERLRALTEASNTAWFKRQDIWEAEVKADPGLGGRSYQQNVAEARRVFIPGANNPLVGSTEEAEALKQALAHTGAGSNPAFVRLFLKASRFMAARAAQTKLNNMYPEMG